MALSEILYQRALPIWEKALTRPFVREMAVGSLPLEKFRYYMLQDYAYLKEYCKLYALCMAATDDFSLMSYLCQSMQATVDETLRVHVPAMKALGIGEETLATLRPHRDSLSYSSFMLWQAQRNGLLTGLVELLNCSWSYALLGQRLVCQYPEATEHPVYGSWFRSYAGEAYQADNRRLIALVDRVGAEASTAETGRLCELFCRCAQYELSFWDMAYRGEEP